MTWSRTEFQKILEAELEKQFLRVVELESELKAQTNNGLEPSPLLFSTLQVERRVYMRTKDILELYKKYGAESCERKPPGT